jgi:hypothetical protein
MVAYPWVGLVAGLALVLFVGTAAIHGRHSRPLPAVVPKPKVSLARKIALRDAWRDLNDI